jgi:hypothetical protein
MEHTVLTYEIENVSGECGNLLKSCDLNRYKAISRTKTQQIYVTEAPDSNLGPGGFSFFE